MATAIRTLKIKIFIAFLIRNFLIQGCLKSFGVIISDTIDRVHHTTLPIVALSFALLVGLNFASAPIALLLMIVFKTRTILIFGGFLIGSGFVCQGVLADNIWLLFVSNITTGVGFGLLTLPLTIALAQCFGDSFGSALSGINVLSNVGMAVLPPLLEYWRDSYGLTGALVLLGALMWNTVISGVLIPGDFEKEEEEEGGIDDQNSTSYEDLTNTDSTEKTAARESKSKISKGIIRQHAIVGHPTLLLLYVAQFCNMFILTSWAMFLIPYGVSKGYRQSVVVYLSTIGGSGVVTGRLCMFFVFYFKWHKKLIILLTPILLLLSSLLLFTQIEEFLYLGILSFISGASAGYMSSWMFAYTKYVSCLPHFKTASACSMVVTGISAFSSGFLSGLVHDIRGTYSDVFMLLAALAVVKAAFTTACIIYNKRCRRCNCNDDGTM